jgi:hypothetical protein
MLFLTALILHSASALAAPVAPTLNLYCLVLSQPGGPQGPLSVNYGEEKEIGTFKGTRYLVSYGNDLALENVIQLRALKVATNKQSVAVTILNGSLPARVDLISEKGNVSCMNTDAWK